MPISTPEEGRKLVDEQAAKGVDIIKLWVDDERKTIPIKMPLAVSAAIIDEAHKKHLRAVAHVFYLADAKELVREGINGFAHMVRDQPVDNELLSMMKAKGVWMVSATLSREMAYSLAIMPWLNDPFFTRGVTPGTLTALKSTDREKAVVLGLTRFPGLPYEKKVFLDMDRTLFQALENYQAMVKAGIEHRHGHRLRSRTAASPASTRMRKCSWKCWRAARRWMRSSRPPATMPAGWATTASAPSPPASGPTCWCWTRIRLRTSTTPRPSIRSISRAIRCRPSGRPAATGRKANASRARRTCLTCRTELRDCMYRRGDFQVPARRRLKEEPCHPPARPTRVRHTVLALVVVVYFITYLDRVLLSNALPVIQKQFHFSIDTLGLILGCYNWAYALFQIPGGWFGDRVGPRIALASVVIWWSVFTFLTGFSFSVTMMMVCLFLIGMGEAGAFPISNRALSRWMLPTERGFAQGATHAGSRLAGTAAPILVATLIGHYGWHVPFFVFATVGVVWAAVWIWYYRDVPSEHASVNDAERHKIVSALGDAKKRQPIPMEPDPVQPADVDAGRDVFLLRLLPEHVPGLVSQISGQRARLYAGGNGLLRQPAAGGRRGGRYLRRRVLGHDHPQDRPHQIRPPKRGDHRLSPGGGLRPAGGVSSRTAISAPRCSAARCSGWNWWWAMPGR